MVVALGLIVMGVFFVLAGWGRFGDQDRFFKNSYEVPGVVTSVVEQTFEAGSSQRQPRVRFRGKDGLYEFDAPVRAKAHGLWPEQKVQVTLSPDFPNVAMLKLHQHKRSPAYMVIGAVFLAIGLFLAPSLIDPITDQPMMALIIVATVAAAGVSMIGTVRQHLHTYYSLSDNIRPASDAELPDTQSGVDALSDEGNAVVDASASRDRPAPVALETQESAIVPWSVILGILGVFALVLGIRAPWPYLLPALVPAIGLFGLAVYLLLRKRRKFWDAKNQSVVTATRWPGQKGHEFAEPIRNFKRVEVLPVSHHSDSGGKSTTSIRVTVVHRDDDMLMANGQYSWIVASYSDYSRKTEAEDFACQVAFTLDLPLVNKLY